MENKKMQKNLNEKLISDMKVFGQFPYGKRDRPYQGIAGQKGIRDMDHRYKIMNLPNSFQGSTVLDLGCSLGAICVDAKSLGAERVVGLDIRKETIDMARNIAEEYKLEIEYYTFNINDGLESLKTLIGENIFDHVFALSIWGHVQISNLADMINYYTKNICWFEGHAGSSISHGHGKEEKFFDLLNTTCIDFLGETSDRNLRRNFKLTF